MPDTPPPQVKCDTSACVVTETGPDTVRLHSTLNPAVVLTLTAAEYAAWVASVQAVGQPTQAAQPGATTPK